MSLSPAERAAKINDLKTIVKEKGFDDLLNNHIDEICDIRATAPELFDFANTDSKLKDVIANMPIEEQKKLKTETPLFASTSPTPVKKNVWDVNGLVEPKLIPQQHPEIKEKDGSGVLFLKE